ncbi:uncharacterized protein LOC118435367 isoform X2 [Folsomia candida]|uniref:DUF4806 domain-containing protein n=1 Tax=Folsomia candida TaxID=158441 RepID=A0A226EDU0_FOLCA|nr:uncharacterized protein LOC118433365 isoform X2 [Folsomia candida]XP_035707246.1 uncharacterized protein LOC118435367 isoform X2 [Folsomia candida]OXA38002.1 hypothetical protein Fcan01_27224 [Folsomia candida]OXA55692.1 hypothetical protein Fcan01_08969 [Folsomia candida]
MFSVVKFKTDNSVQVVSSNWLSDDKKYCHWPPGPNSNPTAKIKKHEVPTSKWPKLEVKFWKATDNYNEARNLEKAARETSDLDTTDTETTSLSSANAAAHSSPLIISTDNFQCMNETLSNPADNVLTIKGINHPSSSLIQFEDQIFQVDVFNNATFPHDSNNSEEGGSSVAPLARPVENNQAQSSAAAIPTSCEDLLSEILKRQLALERLVGEGFAAIKDDNRSILGHLGGKDSEPNVLLPVDIPLTCAADFSELDTWLEDATNSKKLEHIFCAIGGKSIQKVVSGIMKRIFSKELAAKVNWNGHNEKIRFEISNLCKVVIAAARATKTEQSTELPAVTEVAKHIQNWLRNQREFAGQCPPSKNVVVQKQKKKDQ